MRKFVITILFLVLAVIGFSQNPDIFPLADLKPTLSSERGGASQLKWYTTSGRYSTVGLRMNLEPGLRVIVLERLQRIPGDADGEHLDECFVENRGQWKIGRVYLPFGSQNLVRECVLSLLYNTQLVIDDLPISIAVCDGGKGRQRGVSARIGKRLGVSFAVGNHFGVSASSFAATRGTSNSPGIGGGYQFLVGVDYAKRVREVRFAFEGVALRESERESDRTDNISDFEVSVDLLNGRFVVGGAWSREWVKQIDYVRLFGSFRIDDRIRIEPMLRYRRGGFRDLSLTVSAKL